MLFQKKHTKNSYALNRVEGRMEKVINWLQDQLFGEKSFLKDIEQDAYNQVNCGMLQGTIGPEMNNRVKYSPLIITICIIHST